MSYENIGRLLSDNTTIDDNSPNDFNNDDNNQQVDGNLLPLP